MTKSIFNLISPDGLPTHREPCHSLNELVKRAAAYPLRFAHQGYYKDSNMRELTLEQLANSLSVQVHSDKNDEPVTVELAYARYVDHNLERMNEGWRPMGLAEFEDSSEFEEFVDTWGGEGPRILCNVTWDFVGEEEEPEGVPNDIVVFVKRIGIFYKIEHAFDELGDYLSDQYGWCVHSIDHRILDPEEPIPDNAVIAGDDE